jgi:hypothetical protein
LGSISFAKPVARPSFGLEGWIAGKRTCEIQGLGRIGSRQDGVEKGLGCCLAELVEAEN